MERYQEIGKALGSDVVLTIVGTIDSPEATLVFKELWRTITLFEDRFSRFKSDSELTKLNQNAGSHVELSQETIALVRVAKQYMQKTNGLYNPFILPNLQRVGYLGSWPLPAETSAGLDYTARNLTDSHSLEIGPDSVKIPRDSALDFGGIGKGYLLDKLSLLLKDLSGYWLSLGGDILCQGHDLEEAEWKVGIAEASDPHKLVATVHNQQGQRLAIATSGTTKRRGVVEGRQWHHLIDPRTGQSAVTDVLTATVCSSSATEADIYAKCIVLLGEAEARTFISEKLISDAVMQTTTGVKTFGALAKI